MGLKTLRQPNFISGFPSTPSPDGSVGQEEMTNIHASEHDIFGYRALKISIFCMFLAFICIKISLDLFIHRPVFVLGQTAIV
jgi:hypothetical protein